MLLAERLAVLRGDPRVAELAWAELVELEGLLAANPLLGFEPHSVAQRVFLGASTPVVAAFAGNRFGKSTVLVVALLRELLPGELLPGWLRGAKRFEAPAHGWLMCPTEDKIFDSLKPAFERWCPPSAFVGGSWGRAFNGGRMMLSFECGSTLGFKTYKQDASTLGGASLHVVGYDEPPPVGHREEGMTRLIDHGGFELFAMTPVNVNTSWIRREIYRKREAPHITVVSGSMHDNPTLDAAQKELVLSSYKNDLVRRAREFGEFLDVGGLVYPEFERCVVEPPSVEDVRRWDVVVGIDPGIRNCGITFCGFDRDNVLTVFDELLLQDRGADEYAEGIDAVLSRWGLRRDDVMFVIDPAARQRGQVNAETVMSALMRAGVFCAEGQNDVEAGCMQLRSRMASGRFFVSRGCVGLRDEADDYAMEDRDDGVFRVIKGNDHRLDSLRYAAMFRPWDAGVEMSAPQRRLGWVPGRAPAAGELVVPQAGAPLGFMS